MENLDPLKNEKEFVALFRACVQVGPYDWETITPTLKVTRETTVGEILEWSAKNYHEHSVIIQELKTLKP